MVMSGPPVREDGRPFGTKYPDGRLRPSGRKCERNKMSTITVMKVDMSLFGVLYPGKHD